MFAFPQTGVMCGKWYNRMHPQPVNSMQNFSPCSSTCFDSLTVNSEPRKTEGTLFFSWWDFYEIVVPYFVVLMCYGLVDNYFRWLAFFPPTQKYFLQGRLLSGYFLSGKDMLTFLMEVSQKC